MSFNNLSNYTGMAGGGLELSSQIAGLGSETGQVADGDTLLEALAKVNDRLPLSGGTITGDILAAPYGPQILCGYGNSNSGAVGTRGLVAGSSGYIGFTNGAADATTNNVGDLQLKRGGAGILQQRKGTAAQESQIYGTYTDASNYERLALRTAAGDYTIAAEAAGTGTQRNLVLSGANRAAHIADVSTGTDTAYETAINAIIAALESHGIAATS